MPAERARAQVDFMSFDHQQLPSPIPNSKVHFRSVLETGWDHFDGRTEPNLRQLVDTSVDLASPSSMLSTNNTVMHLEEKWYDIGGEGDSRNQRPNKEYAFSNPERRQIDANNKEAWGDLFSDGSPSSKNMLIRCIEDAVGAIQLACRGLSKEAFVTKDREQVSCLLSTAVRDMCLVQQEFLDSAGGEVPGSDSIEKEPLDHGTLPSMASHRPAKIQSSIDSSSSQESPWTHLCLEDQLQQKQTTQQRAEFTFGPAFFILSQGSSSDFIAESEEDVIEYGTLGSTSSKEEDKENKCFRQAHTDNACTSSSRTPSPFAVDDDEVTVDYFPITDPDEKDMDKKGASDEDMKLFAAHESRHVTSTTQGKEHERRGGNDENVCVYVQASNVAHVPSRYENADNKGFVVHYDDEDEDVDAEKGGRQVDEEEDQEMQDDEGYEDETEYYGYERDRWEDDGRQMIWTIPDVSSDLENLDKDVTRVCRLSLSSSCSSTKEDDADQLRDKEERRGEEEEVDIDESGVNASSSLHLPWHGLKTPDATQCMVSDAANAAEANLSKEACDPCLNGRDSSSMESSSNKYYHSFFGLGASPACDAQASSSPSAANVSQSAAQHACAERRDGSMQSWKEASVGGGYMEMKARNDDECDHDKTIIPTSLTESPKKTRAPLTVIGGSFRSLRLSDPFPTLPHATTPSRLPIDTHTMKLHHDKSPFSGGAAFSAYVSPTSSRDGCAAFNLSTRVRGMMPSPVSACVLSGGFAWEKDVRQDASCCEVRAGSDKLSRVDSWESLPSPRLSAPQSPNSLWQALSLKRKRKNCRFLYQVVRADSVQWRQDPSFAAKKWCAGDDGEGSGPAVGETVGVFKVSDDGQWVQGLNGLWLPTIDASHGYTLMQPIEANVEQGSTQRETPDLPLVSRGGGWNPWLAGVGVTLSSDRRSVEFAEAKPSIVLGEVGYQSGRHVFLFKVVQMSRYTYIGVSPLPPSCDHLDASLSEIGFSICGSSPGEKGRRTTELVSVWCKGRHGMLVRSFQEGDLVGFVLDMDTRTLDYYINGEYVACICSHLPDRLLYPAASNHGLGPATRLSVAFDVGMEDIAGYHTRNAYLDRR